MTLDALKKIDLESQSWEYASEMVLKAAKIKLKTAEVPIRFYKDREGRVSQHKREGWFSPWLAGWLNLKVMFEYAPSFFLKWPGILSMTMGLIITILVIAGILIPTLARFNISWLTVSLMLLTVGYSAWQLSVLADVYYGFDIGLRESFRKKLTYNRGVLTGFMLMLVGVVILIAFMVFYVMNGFALTRVHFTPLFGVMFMVLGFQTFTFTLLMRMLFKRRHLEKNEG